jgi:hypothetical protein
MNLLQRRGWWVLGAAALFAGGALGVACGPNGNGSDGGVDSGNNDGTLPGDSGKDGQSSDGGPGNDAAPTTCEAGVSGECDIYAQNCPSGKDCEVVGTADGGITLQCVTNQNAKPEGYACTTSGNNPYSGQCVAGTLCVFGRCSKPCCGNSNCGTSEPEKIQGQCTLKMSFDGNDDFTACTYASPCEPFHLQACTAGEGCNVLDVNGTASCSEYASGTDAGLAEHKACTNLNDCNDGMGCYGSPDGGPSNCQWNCYNKGQGGPYDSQVAADAGAGYGGCPSGETCQLINWAGSLPAWLGLCSK